MICGPATMHTGPPKFPLAVGTGKSKPFVSIMSPPRQRAILPRPPNHQIFIQKRNDYVYHHLPSTSRNNHGEWAEARGESLRRKIEQRPSKERLVTQHILLSDGRVAPLIEQKARLLRQDRIRSNLAKKLKQRPGPLELVTRKILQADRELEEAIQEGRVLFQPTSDHEGEEDCGRGPFTPDMEVVSQVMVRQPPKSLGVLANKGGILRKSSKMSPYKPPEPVQFRGKTKTPERKDDEVTVIEERIGNTGQVLRPIEQSSYELLLQQQQLFLQWQQQENNKDSLNDDSQMIELQSGNSPLTSLNGQPLKIRRLSDFKVQELKNECKKRQLPVSGAKPQLLERLRGFEKEILGATPPPSPDLPKETCRFSPDILSQETTHEVVAITSQQPSASVHQSGTTTQTVTMNIDSAHRQSISMPMDFSRQPQMVLHVQNNGPQLVQLVDEKGAVLGMATVQYQQPPQQDAPRPPAVVLQQPCQIVTPISAHSLDTVQQMTAMPPRVVQATQVVQKQNVDSTFRFAQMGSGGQFTVIQSSDRMDQKPTVTVTSTSGVVSKPAPLPAGMIPVRGQTPVVVYQSKPLPKQETTQVIQANRNIKPALGRMTSPKLQSSPRTADQPGSSPNMPHGGKATQAESVQADDTKDDDVIALDPSDPASVLTPSTLRMHEDMLRNQHRMIENLEKEISSAQSMLKRQQQIILAAKKAQQKLREQQRYEGETTAVARGDQQWLRDLDIRHVNKQHIQQFLQHKMHVQTLTGASTEHNRLKTTEARLQEELHVDQAVHDIVRLIKQDPRTALLIVQLLRKYQLERSQQETTQEVEQKIEEMPEEETTQEVVIEPPKPSMTVTYQQSFANKELENDSDKSIIICEASGRQPLIEHQNSYQEQMTCTDSIDKDGAVEPDMEAIFKCVLEDASRALRDETPVQTVDCNVSAKMASPKQSTDEQQNWNEMIHQSTSAYLVGGPQTSHSSISPVSDQSQMGCSPQNSQMELIPDQTMQNHLDTVDQFAAAFRPPENTFSSLDDLDDVMGIIQADAAGSAAFSSSTVAPPFGEYGSDELAELLGDDWLNCADRSIAHDGQYAPYQQEMDDGRSTDPMSLGIPMESMETSENDQMNNLNTMNNMDWLDEMLHHTPVDGLTFGH